MARVNTILQNILAGASYDVIPPVGEDWEVVDLASSAMVGVPPAGVPNVTAGIFSAVAVNGLFRNSSAANPHVRGWMGPPSWFINNSNWLRVTNPEAGPLDIGIVIARSKTHGSLIQSGVISGNATLIATGVQIIRPPLGQDWCITDVGSSRWLGAQPAGLPNVEVWLTDGVNAALIQAGPETRGWNRRLKLHINNACWLELTNPAGAGATVSWSGFISKTYSPNIVYSSVISQVLLLGGGGIGVIQPPAGENWLITDIGCSVWTAGFPPANLPSILVSLADGVIAPPIAQDAADNKGWLEDMNYYLLNTTWMTLTDAGAGSNVAVSGFKWLDN